MFAKTFPGLLEAFLLDIAIFAWSAPLIFALGLIIALLRVKGTSMLDEVNEMRS